MTSGQDTWSARCGSNSHAGCGGRAGETHRAQPRQGAPVRPNLRRTRRAGPPTVPARTCCEIWTTPREVYPDAVWPPQIAGRPARAHPPGKPRPRTGPDRDPHRDPRHAAAPATQRDAVGLSDTTSHGTRPGERKARLLLEVLRDRQDDVLASPMTCAAHLEPGRTRPTTGQDPTEHLRPADQQHRTQDRYTILGYLSTAAKHGLDKITVLRDALTGQPWMPALPAPT